MFMSGCTPPTSGKVSNARNGKVLVKAFDSTVLSILRRSREVMREIEGTLHDAVMLSYCTQPGKGFRIRQGSIKLKNESTA